MTETIKKNYYDLAYRIFIAAAIGSIPYFLFTPIINIIDCESDELTSDEQLKCHTTTDGIIPTMKWIMIPVFCVIMFSIAFIGVYSEWQRGNRPQSEIEESAKQFKLEYEKQNAEDNAIREKYDSMPYLVEKKK